MSDPRGQHGVLAWVLLALTAAAATAAAVWAVRYHEWCGHFSDPVDYLLLADYYRGSVFNHFAPAIQEHYRATRFPPLFPMILALGGGGTGHVPEAVLVTQVMVLLAAVAVAAYLIRESRHLLEAALLVVPIVLCPGIFLINLDPVSEPLFVALVYLALACSHDRVRLWITPVLFALAPLARVVGVCAVPALAVWRWRAARPPSRWRAAASFVAVSAAPAAAWLIYRRTLGSSDNYLTQLTHDSVHPEFGGWTSWLLGQPLRLVRSVAALLDPGEGSWAIGVALVLAVLAVIGAVLRWRRNALDVQFAAVYLGLLLVWPFPAEMARLMSVLLPIVLISARDGAAALLALRPDSRRDPSHGRLIASAAVFLLSFSASAPSLARLAHRMALPVAAGLEPYTRSREFLLAADDDQAEGVLQVQARVRYAILALKDYVPEQDCVYTISPQIVAVYGGRVTQIMPSEIRPDIPVRAQFPVCRYVLVTHESTYQRRESPLYPLDEIKDVAAPVFASNLLYKGQPHLAAALLRFKD